MNAWFSPETSHYFSYLSLMSLMALMSYWVRQGRHRSFVIGSFIASIGLGLALLVAGGMAWLLAQPPHVAQPMLLSGLVITVVFAATIGSVHKAYLEADQRRIVAKDI